MPTPPPTMFNRFRRRRTCNAQGLVGLDVLLARCHRTCQPPRRALDVVVVPAGQKKQNRRQMCRGPRRCPSLNAATQARGGWEGMSLERGAARSAAALGFPRALPIARFLQIDAKRAEPFSAPLQKPKKCEIDVNCAKWRLMPTGGLGSLARRGAERRRHSTAQLMRNFANRRQLRRGPRGNPSLTAATCTLDHIREVEGRRDQQRGALLPSGNRDFLTPSKTEKYAN
ncbi:hypothetical protein EV715DRAFT_298294 [Schizophyllum commune]